MYVQFDIFRLHFCFLVSLGLCATTQPTDQLLHLHWSNNMVQNEIISPVANFLFHFCSIGTVKFLSYILCFWGLQFISKHQSGIVEYGGMELLIKSICMCQPCVVSTGTLLFHPQLIINQPIVDQQLWVQPLRLPETRRLITSAWALISLVFGHIWFLFICLCKQARWVLTCFDTSTNEYFAPFWNL